MATVDNVVGCFEDLRDKLYSLSGNSDYDDADRDDFLNLSTEAGDAAEAFSEHPKCGPSSSDYDPALAAGRAAVDAAGQTTAGNGGSIGRCKEKSRTAMDAIQRVTN